MSELDKQIEQLKRGEAIS
jgi:serine/threonine-protein phosphatase 4 catalytic subunit